MSSKIKYLSVIEKWLHHDNPYRKGEVSEILGFSSNFEYSKQLEKPWKHFSIEQMDKMAELLPDKTIVEVFWACYKKPYIDICHDEEQVKLNQSLDRAGIR